MVNLSLDLAKDVSRVIWIQDYDEDGVLNKIKSTFKDYKIHIWNSINPSMFGITVNDDVSTDLHRFIYWVSQRFTGKDILVILDFGYYLNDHKVIRAIKLSKPYLEKKDCYIICLSGYIYFEHSDIDINDIKSTLLILKNDTVGNSNDVINIVKRECANVNINPEDININNHDINMLLYRPKPVIEMAVRLSLRVSGKLDDNIIAKF
ncbi:MAG: hypothetical protein QXD03_03095 [Candidatus Anstonellales archaeon]